MDRRGWLWKKKSSDKTDKAAVASEAAAGSRGEQDNYKKPNYVQISVESYSHLTGLEDQVKTYEEQVQMLEDQIQDSNEKLSAAQAEITTKDNLVKQHNKVAEEAVSGWEKAEAEALALKSNLESVTLSKLTAEDRASHLDGALKECMRQIRNLKEEHEQKLQDVVLTKNKQFDKIRLEFEAKIANLDQELLKSAAENAAISRSLQERSNMLIKINEEKAQAEAEIELLKSNIESCEREINSLKYELHLVSKELDIRNEEKNMSMRSAEAANKLHTEGVKKIAKLEAECQRLRGLVRKKLPGPAALAQMKLEVESLGRDYGDTRLRRSPVKPSSPHLSPVPDYSIENVQKFHKENEFLTERLLAMEEETKMLKEALAKRNTELQASRNLCAKTASRLQSLEAQMQQKNPSKIPAEAYSGQGASNPPSLTSMSEDGNEDTVSCAESWATALISELSHVKKDNKSDESKKVENANHLGLMDDFLEMEKLACLSNDPNANGSIPILDSSNGTKSDTLSFDASAEVTAHKDLESEKQNDLKHSVNQNSPNVDLSAESTQSNVDELPVMRLRSGISLVLESMPKDADMDKVLEDIKRVVQDVHDSLCQHSITQNSQNVPSLDATCEGTTLIAKNEISLSPDSKTSVILQVISQELAAAISQIHDFVIFLGKEAGALHDASAHVNGFKGKIEEFSITFNKVLSSDKNLADFVLNLSHVLSEANELKFSILGFKGSELEIHSPDCIDKVVLPEDKVVQKALSGERYKNGCTNISSPTSNPEVPDDGNVVSGYDTNNSAGKFTLEEFEELKLEKEKTQLDLARSIENLGVTKSQLQETEQLLAEVKSQLASAQKSNSLAETQLKCMAESYRTLETRSEELETELNLLRGKIDNLENELEDEKNRYHDALTRCKELEEQLQRNENCSICSAAADLDLKNKQEKELAAAAEKLAECQETIFLLGKQLKALRPQTEQIGSSPFSERSQRGEDEPSISGTNLQELDQAEIDTATSSNVQRVGAESPNFCNSPCSPSDTEANNLMKSPISSNHPKHRSTKSTSSSSSSAPTPEKHSRGFSRFFSSKGRSGH
ncbi:filament-like plant protein 4 [Carica papaya]|uniref:filament-like plant protein 4 n=1 Tax=Carica papaya TaxID=3649 RepID=UPI000B8D0691|nr:filament-like plant protein 4 [Carica papaya]